MTEWRQQAPWPTDAQVEQDLVICRALIEMFRHREVAQALIFRGGTAIYKLHLRQGYRYSLEGAGRGALTGACYRIQRLADTRTIEMPSLLSKAFTILRGVVYSAAFVWLWAWLAVTVQRYDAQLPFSLPIWLRPLGFALAAAGAVLAGTCIATFVTRGRGTPAPFDPPREFVASGPYRYVRNPMYVGGAAVILGAGLAVSSPSIVLLAVAFLLIVHLFVVIHEEPSLADKFGVSYQQYRASVHRWIIRRPSSGAR